MTPTTATTSTTASIFLASWQTLKTVWEGFFGIPFSVFVLVAFVIPLLILLWSIFVGRREERR